MSTEPGKLAQSLPDAPKPELLPCPFCGADPMLNEIAPHKHYFVDFPDHEGSAVVECPTCEAGMIAEDMDITTEMITTINAQYRAKTSTGSSISIEITDIPRDIHLMIVWALNHPEAALDLIPRYYQARAEHEARAEGSAKNHGIEP